MILLNSYSPIDFEYYLAHQILPPIERLCEPIEGTDRARLAECLGMQVETYTNYPLVLISFQVWILRDTVALKPRNDHSQLLIRRCQTLSVSKTLCHSESDVVTALERLLLNLFTIERYDTVLFS